MPPHDGEDMAPTKRFDEPGDDDSVGSAHPERWTRRSDSRPRRVRVVDDALRSGSTAPEREGTRYLGIPQQQLQWTAQCNPGAHASGSRDSPNIENPGTAQRFQIWVVRLILAATSTQRLQCPKTHPMLRPRGGNTSTAHPAARGNERGCPRGGGARRDQAQQLELDSRQSHSQGLWLQLGGDLTRPPTLVRFHHGMSRSRSALCGKRVQQPFHVLC
jgi:hypothetical protein